MIKVLNRLLLIYLAIVTVNFLYALIALNYPAVAKYERKLVPAEFVFWQGGEFYSNPPLFPDAMSDVFSELRPVREDGDENDVDIWVLLLDGYDDIHNVSFASELGLDPDKIAMTEPSTSLNISSVSLRARLHLLPFYVHRKKIIIDDARYLAASYHRQCLDELIYGEMVDRRDQAKWNSCKRDV